MTVRLSALWPPNPHLRGSFQQVMLLFRIRYEPGERRPSSEQISGGCHAANLRLQTRDKRFAGKTFADKKTFIAIASKKSATTGAPPPDTNEPLPRARRRDKSASGIPTAKAYIPFSARVKSYILFSVGNFQYDPHRSNPDCHATGNPGVVDFTLCRQRHERACLVAIGKGT